MRKPRRHWSKRVKPKPMNRKHLDPRSAFMRQIAEERAIGIHPKYRNAAARRLGPTVAEWRALQIDWREQNPVVAL